MQQTRLVSLIEATINTATGFMVSFALWPIAAYITGIEYTATQHWSVVAIFTASSVARSYVVRRFFNAELHLIAVNMATKINKRG